MAQSIFDKSTSDLKAIAELRRWGPGEPVDHRKLNEAPAAINRMIRGVTGARQNRFTEVPEGGGQSVQFRVHTNRGDYIVAREWDGTAYMGPEVAVAKRYLLRRTPFHQRTRQGVRYEYVEDNERLANGFVDGESWRERQFITPSYWWGDVIYAIQNPTHGTGVVVEEGDENLGQGAVIWLADVDSRAWAWDGVVENGDATR